MTGLFDVKIKIQKRQDKPKIEPSAPLVAELDDISPVPELNQVSAALPLSQEVEPSPAVVQANDGVVLSNGADLGQIGDDDISFGETKTANDVISDMTGDDPEFAVKGVTPFPPAFSAAQVQADYNDSLGFLIVGELLRGVCRWQYKHNASKKGERAKLVFGALGQQVQQEFQLEKEAKGLLGR